MPAAGTSAGRRRQLRGLSGVTQLRRKLRRMPDAVTNPIRESLKAAAFDIQKRAVGNLYIKGAYITGRLADTMKVRFGRDGFTAYIGQVDARVRRRGFYGKFVERGTRHSVRKAFLGPAYDVVAPSLKTTLKARIDKALKEVALGGG